MDKHLVEKMAPLSVVGMAPFWVDQMVCKKAALKADTTAESMAERKVERLVELRAVRMVAKSVWQMAASMVIPSVGTTALSTVELMGPWMV